MSQQQAAMQAYKQSKLFNTFMKATAVYEQYIDQDGSVPNKLRVGIRYGNALLTAVGVSYVVALVHLERGQKYNDVEKVKKFRFMTRTIAATFLLGCSMFFFASWRVYQSIPEHILRERVVEQEEKFLLLLRKNIRDKQDKLRLKEKLGQVEKNPVNVVIDKMQGNQKKLL